MDAGFSSVTPADRRAARGALGERAPARPQLATRGNLGRADGSAALRVLLGHGGEPTAHGSQSRSPGTARTTRQRPRARGVPHSRPPRRSGDRATRSQRGRSRRPHPPCGAGGVCPPRVGGRCPRGSGPSAAARGPAPSRARGFPRGDLRPPTAAARARTLLRAVLWPRGSPLGAARLLLDGISGSGRVRQSRPGATRTPGARVLATSGACIFSSRTLASVQGHLLRDSRQSTDAGHEGTGTEFLTRAPRTHAKAESCTSTEGNVSLKSALAVGCKKCLFYLVSNQEFLCILCVDRLLHHQDTHTRTHNND